MTTMTTCGYGDIHPYTSNERLASMMAMIISSVVFGFIINDIGKMVSKLNILANSFHEKMTYVDRFMI